MELHHDKHHATYVKGADTALEQLAAAGLRCAGNGGANLAFNLGGHINYSVF